jgi:hypothetical protein
MARRANAGFKSNKAERQAELGKRHAARILASEIEPPKPEVETNPEVEHLDKTIEGVEKAIDNTNDPAEAKRLEKVVDGLEEAKEEVNNEGGDVDSGLGDVGGDKVGDEEAVEGDGERKPSSVVKPVFKERYAANARELGVKGKAAKRSNWDWLAQEIAKFCLTDKHAIRMDDFKALLKANGIDHNKWPNQSRGWEGRLRMTGRVALQRIVADSGVLKFPDETEAKAPMDFILKYKAK